MSRLTTIVVRSALFLQARDMVTNCCFGGPDLKTFYDTAGKTLWQPPMKVPGRVVWPPIVK